MAVSLTDQFRIFSAKNLSMLLEGPDANQSDDGAGTTRDRVYLFIGRSITWDNENSPPQAVDSFSEFSDSYDDMISLKRVSASGYGSGVRRIDWVSPEQTTGGLGFTYDMYRHDYSPSKTASSGATKLYDSDFMLSTRSIRSTSDLQRTLPVTLTENLLLLNLQVLLLLSLLLVMVIVGSICIPSLWHQVLKFFSNDYMPVFTNDAVQTNAVAGEVELLLSMLQALVITTERMITLLSMVTELVVEFLLLLMVVRLFLLLLHLVALVIHLVKSVLIAITGIGTGTGGQVDVIIPPPGGHGYDSVVELGAFRVMINAKLSYDEGAGDFPIDNDYRRIGLITNPFKFGTSELISDLTVSATKAVIFSPTFQGNYVPDEIITQTTSCWWNNVTARARVISWNATTKF